VRAEPDVPVAAPAALTVDHEPDLSPRARAVSPHDAPPSPGIAGEDHGARPGLALADLHGSVAQRAWRERAGQQGGGDLTVEHHSRIELAGIGRRPPESNPRGRPG